MSTVLLYNFFRDSGFSASYTIDPLLVTDDIFGNSNCIMDKTAKKIMNTVFGDFTIVPGFYGATEDGQITTVGRGGSDYTAMVFASVLNCDDVVGFLFQISISLHGNLACNIREKKFIRPSTAHC